MEQLNQSDGETELLRKKVELLEEEAARKDLKISQLMSRLREYELGDYGLAQAVSEIKDCRKTIRARDRDIERFTDEINSLKLQISNLTCKSETPDKSSYIFYGDSSPMSSEKVKSPSLGDTLVFQQTQKIVTFDKSTQCHLWDNSFKYLDEMYDKELQNEQLRLELNEVCESALKSSICMQAVYRKDTLEKEKTIESLKERLKHQSGSLAWENSNRHIISSDITKHMEVNFTEGEPTPNDDPKDCYKAIVECIKHEDVQVQEIFHHLSNEIRILKNKQMAYIRRFILLTDNEARLQAENFKLKKVLKTNIQSVCDNSNRIECELIEALSSEVLNIEDRLLIKNLSDNSKPMCQNSTCEENNIQQLQLIMKLLKEITLLKKLIEIAHHQTQAVEAICFAQDIKLKALEEQYIFFQSQSDEKLLLGKLAMKVLELQFNQAACLYELKKCRSENKVIQGSYSSLQKEYNQSKKKLVDLYNEAQEKVKHLQSIIKDLGQQCNIALETD